MYFNYRTSCIDDKKFSEDENINFYTTLISRYNEFFKWKLSAPDILVKLDKHFYVSSKNKPLFDCLVKGPECPIERNYPLLRRIGVKNLNINNI